MNTVSVTNKKPPAKLTYQEVVGRHSNEGVIVQWVDFDRDVCETVQFPFCVGTAEVYSILLTS